MKPNLKNMVALVLFALVGFAVGANATNPPSAGAGGKTLHPDTYKRRTIPVLPHPKMPHVMIHGVKLV